MLSELRHSKFTYLFHCFDLDRNGVLERTDYEQFGERLGDDPDAPGNRMMGRF